MSGDKSSHEKSKKKTIPFTKIENFIIDDYRLSKSDLIVYLGLRRHANKNGKNSFPGIRTIAKETRTRKTTVIKSIEKLSNLEMPEVYGGYKYIEVVKRSKGRKKNIYSVIIPKFTNGPIGRTQRSNRENVNGPIGRTEQDPYKDTNNNTVVRFSKVFNFSPTEREVKDNGIETINRIMNYMLNLDPEKIKNPTGYYKTLLKSPETIPDEISTEKDWNPFRGS